jgi:hypothetical protein
MTLRGSFLKGGLQPTWVGAGGGGSSSNDKRRSRNGFWAFDDQNFIQNQMHSGPDVCCAARPWCSPMVLAHGAPGGLAAALVLNTQRDSTVCLLPCPQRDSTVCLLTCPQRDSTVCLLTCPHRGTLQCACSHAHTEGLYSVHAHTAGLYSVPAHTAGLYSVPAHMPTHRDSTVCLLTCPHRGTLQCACSHRGTLQCVYSCSHHTVPVTLPEATWPRFKTTICSQLQCLGYILNIILLLVLKYLILKFFVKSHRLEFHFKISLNEWELE